MSLRFRPCLEPLDGRIVPSAAPGTYSPPPPGQGGNGPQDNLAAWIDQYQNDATAASFDIIAMQTVMTEIDRLRQENLALLITPAPDPATEALVLAQINANNQAINGLMQGLQSLYFDTYLPRLYSLQLRQVVLLSLVPTEDSAVVVTPPVFTVPEHYLPPGSYV